MSEDATNVAPAGGAETTADSKPKFFSSLDAAAAAIGALEPESENEPVKPETEPEDDSAEDTTEEADTEAPDDEEDDTEAGDEDDAPDEESDDDEESEPESESESVDFESLKGDTKVRLRDGTEWTVGELKRRIDDLRGVDERTQQMDQAFGQMQSWAQGVQQQYQQTQNVLPVAIQAVANTLPEPPEYPELTTENSDDYDPVGNMEKMVKYQQEVDNYNNALNQLHGLRAQFQQMQQHNAEAEKQQVQQYVAYQRQQLLENVPEFKDPEMRDKFQDELFEYATKHYKWSEDEIQNAYDWRLIPLMRDAIAYRKLQENKPKPTDKKIGRASAEKPTVMAPQKRVKQEPQKTAKDKKVAAIRKKGGGSLREIGSLIADL